VLSAGEWVHAAWTYDGTTDTAKIYLNGSLDGGPFGQIGPQGGGNMIVGARDNGGAPFFGMADDIAIWTEVIPEGHIVRLAAGGSPIASALAIDEDGDGLPDQWEARYGVDDPNGDDDGDGLNNREEFEAGLNPIDDDSDDDGLQDDVELFLELDPCNPDMDGDGLTDGEEVRTYRSDPTVVDTDGDGIDDGEEVAYGLDPSRNDLQDDTNGNGWSNLFEYLFGLNASEPGPTPELDVDLETGTINQLGTPTTVVEEVENGVNYSFLYSRNKSFASLGLQEHVEFSGNLVTFFPNEGGEEIVIDDGSVEIVKVTYPFFTPDGRKARFWRMIIE
jgi:hypothetical protein